MQLRKICMALFVLSVVVELLVVYVRQPKVSVKMGDPIQPSNILSSPAILSNTGMLPIYDISVRCTGPGTIVETKGKVVLPPDSQLHGTLQIDRLGAGEAVTANDICKSPAIEQPTLVDAVIRVEFRPLLLPTEHREFRVISRGNGLEAALVTIVAQRSHGGVAGRS